MTAIFVFDCLVTVIEQSGICKVQLSLVMPPALEFEQYFR